jgi:pyruvate dehydrogenase E1 component alpha subunit
LVNQTTQEQPWQQRERDISKYDPQLLRDFLREMLLIRLFEQRCEELVFSNDIVGGVHLAIGQEAVSVGVIRALKEEDYVTGPHRGHHLVISKGVDLGKTMAELMGKADGICGGRGGHMHIADKSKGLLGVNGIVGGSIVMATGAAFTAQYLERDQVSVAFFGDGSANKGQFHECLNLASILDLPAIYVCENNGYAVETLVSYSTGVDNIAERGASYRIPGVIVDGLDVLDVYEAAKEARHRAVTDKRPTLIEAKTYRFKGHSIGDVENYRTKEEVREYMKKDPIGRLRVAMEDHGLINETEWNRMNEEVKAQIEEAVKYGLNSPEPDLTTALRHVLTLEEN